MKQASAYSGVRAGQRITGIGMSVCPQGLAAADGVICQSQGGPAQRGGEEHKARQLEVFAPVALKQQVKFQQKGEQYEGALNNSLHLVIDAVVCS